MSSDEQWIKAVTKLIELTQADSLKWERSTSTHGIVQNDDYRVQVVFTTEFESHKLRLFRARKRIVPIATITVYAIVEQPKEPYWTAETILEIVDDYGISMYQFPYVSAISDLYNSVIAKTSRIDDLLSKLQTKKP